MSIIEKQPISSDGLPVQNATMTDLLEKAVATVRDLPEDMQDEIARMVLAFAANDAAIYQLTPEEEADLDESDAEAARGEFATDEQMRFLWAKHGR